MKYISILRHGRASHSPGFEDFDRPLTSKGRKRLPRVAAFVAGSKVKPDWIISSPALRAKESAELLAEGIQFSSPIAWNEQAYLASAIALLDILRESPDVAQHLVLVGHNPGLSNLVAGLSAGGDFRLNFHMSTGSIAILSAQVVHWRQLRWGCAEMTAFAAPRFLKGLG